MGPLRAYAAYPLGFTRDRGGWWRVVGCVLAAWLARRLLRVEGVANVTRRALPIALALVLIVLAIYAYSIVRKRAKRLSATPWRSARSAGI